MKKLILILVAMICSLTAYAADYQNIIVPRPLSCNGIEGEFTLTTRSKIKANAASLVAPAQLFAKDVAAVLGAQPKVVTKGNGAITLSLLNTLAEEEYTLDILPSGISA